MHVTIRYMDLDGWFGEDYCTRMLQMLIGLTRAFVLVRAAQPLIHLLCSWAYEPFVWFLMLTTRLSLVSACQPS